MNKTVEKIVMNHWRQMIDNCYFYRGMSLNNLNLKCKIILDPRKNPLKNMTPLFIGYSELLLNLIEKGLEFNVNDFYVEPLEKVLNWTVSDIKNPGIDFTTNYADASAYAFNYAGSQLKHNFNLITKTIYQCETQPYLNSKERQKLYHMTKRIQKLLKQERNAKHQPVVIKVKRSCEAFQSCMVKELNLGSYDFFLERVIKEIKKSPALSIDRIAFFLHQKSQENNFNIRLIEPLGKNDVEEIIKF